jgi:hypothetical protein
VAGPRFAKTALRPQKTWVSSPAEFSNNDSNQLIAPFLP